MLDVIFFSIARETTKWRASGLGFASLPIDPFVGKSPADAAAMPAGAGPRWPGAWTLIGVAPLYAA